MRAMPSDGRPRGPLADDRFQRDVTRMLLTFFAVAAIDLVAVSLLTRRLRFWFPVWLDPAWESRPDPWVVYSQSYAAGILMIPLLLRSIDREFLAAAGRALRAVYWLVGLGAFAFIVWWKGNLMVEHHKGLEAVAWLLLTGMVWGLIRIAEELPEHIRGIGRRRFLAGVLLGVACFFLVMSVLDPLVQLEVQRVAWSTGLSIEVGFFVPAGVVLLWVARRLRRGTQSVD